MHRIRIPSVLAIIICIQAAAVNAGPLRLTGYDSYSAGQAGSQGAYGGGLGVLYSNPALLCDLDEHFGVGLLMVQPSVEAELLGRPANADIPITYYDSDVGIAGANLDRPLPTIELQNPRANNRQSDLLGYMSLGLVHSLGIENFRLGLNILVPATNLLKVNGYYPDEREQFFTNTVHFMRFGEWSQIFSMLFGAAYQPLPWLSVGASVEGVLAVGATLDAYIPEATVQDYALANVGMETSAGMRGILGVTVRPLEMLSFSLVWRDRRFAKVDAEALLKLWNYHEAGGSTVPKRVVQNHVLALDFEPMEATLSAGARLGAFTVEAGVTWNHWSDYLDVHHTRAQENAVFTPANEGDPLVDGSSFEFSDTFSFSLGLTWQYLEGYTLIGGANYRPSPVPAQTGRTNYVDSDLLSLGLGHQFNFRLWGEAIRVDLGLQFWTMFETTVHKEWDPDNPLIKDEFPDHARTLIGGQPMPEAEGLQTNNPGFPGFNAGGFAVVGSASLSYMF